jgi:hypothetical protein
MEFLNNFSNSEKVTIVIQILIQLNMFKWSRCKIANGGTIDSVSELQEIIRILKNGGNDSHDYQTILPTDKWTTVGMGEDEEVYFAWLKALQQLIMPML